MPSRGGPAGSPQQAPPGMPLASGPVAHPVLSPDPMQACLGEGGRAPLQGRSWPGWTRGTPTTPSPLWAGAWCLRSTGPSPGGATPSRTPPPCSSITGVPLHCPGSDYVQHHQACQLAAARLNNICRRSLATDRETGVLSTCAADPDRLGKTLDAGHMLKMLKMLPGRDVTFN